MTATFYVGDAVTVMNTLPEKSVDLVISSPPFLALRSYLQADHPDKALEGGSQATPGAYIDWLLDVVEACARVLAPHGSLVFELGDTFAGSGGAGGDYNEDGLRDGQPAYKGSDARKNHRVTLADGRTIQSAGISNGLPRKGTAWPLAKSLSLIPETFRFAMVYGTNPHTGRTTPPWRLRNVIRWVRPNPPVGALGDKFRPATSELMVFCKSKDRFFDLDAVREPVSEHTQKYYSADSPYFQRLNANPERQAGTGQLPERGDGGFRQSHPSGGAPPLDWWNILPGGYPGAHYAVWPPELLVKPIKAMCPESVCRVCGEARRRIVETSYIGAKSGLPYEPHVWASGIGDGQAAHSHKKPDEGARVVNETLGFSDCGHDDYRPGLVLDPFAGSGTTLAVATGHGRDATGIDLDERNYELSLDRVGPLILQRGEIRDGAAP